MGNAYGIGAGGLVNKTFNPGTVAMIDASIYLGALVQPAFKRLPGMGPNCFYSKVEAFVSLAGTSPQDMPRHKFKKDLLENDYFHQSRSDHFAEVTRDTDTASLTRTCPKFLGECIDDVVNDPLNDLWQDTLTFGCGDLDSYNEAKIKKVEGTVRKYWAEQGSAKWEWADSAGRSLDHHLKKFETEDGTRAEVSLTVSPSFGTHHEKMGGHALELQDVNMEDFWIAKGFSMLDRDTTGEYPLLLNRGIVRVDCDPAVIDKELVKAMDTYMKLPTTQVVEKRHIVEALRFRYLGFPFEKVAGMEEVCPELDDSDITAEMHKAMKWGFTEIIQETETADDPENLLVGFGEGAEFYAFDPLMMEISTDFTSEFHSAKIGKNAEAFLIFKGQEKFRGRYETLEDGSQKLVFDEGTVFYHLKEVSKDINNECGTNACSKECTAILLEYVNTASKLMWDFRSNIRDFAKDVTFVQERDYDYDNFMPLWTRSKTGAKSHQMIGNEITKANKGNENGLFVDRLFYKSSNQPGLSKMNEQIFSTGLSVQQNLQRIRDDPQIIRQGLDENEEIYKDENWQALESKVSYRKKQKAASNRRNQAKRTRTI